MIRFRCHSCGAKVTAAEAYIGKTGKCAHCGVTITVPASPEQSSKPPEVKAADTTGLELGEAGAQSPAAEARALAAPRPTAGRFGLVALGVGTIALVMAIIALGSAGTSSDDKKSLGRLNDDMRKASNALTELNQRLDTLEEKVGTNDKAIERLQGTLSGISDLETRVSSSDSAIRETLTQLRTALQLAEQNIELVRAQLTRSFEQNLKEMKKQHDSEMTAARAQIRNVEREFSIFRQFQNELERLRRRVDDLSRPVPTPSAPPGPGPKETPKPATPKPKPPGASPVPMPPFPGGLR